jgi:RNA polymerase sigma factor (sigma-70 family)
MTPRFVGESARLAGPPLLRCQTDGRLVDLVRAGNERAFEAIVDRYRRPLLRYCARLLPPARAEDAVQQTFLNAYAAMQRGDAELDLRPWLYRIARNACLNALRENGWSYEQVDELRRGTESAYEVAERRSELREVVAAVHTLPARQREAVVLRELEGRTYDQIAREMHSSEGAVRQLLNRARNTLRAGATALTPVALLAAKSDPHPRGARAEHADRPEHNVAAPKHKADRPQKHNGKPKGNRRKGKKG